MGVSSCWTDSPDEPDSDGSEIPGLSGEGGRGIEVGGVVGWKDGGALVLREGILCD
jgi:hypothetical protein